MEHAVYKNVFDKTALKNTNIDLPKVFSHYVFSKITRSDEEYLLKLQNGDVFLSSYGIGKGMAYIAAVPLNQDFSNFTKHALFVPTLYMIGVNSQSHQPLFYTLGKDESIETTRVIAGDNVYHIKNETSDFDVIPEHKIIDTKVTIYVHNQVLDAGNYDLVIGKEHIMPLSFNYNRMESDLSCYTPNEIQNMFESNSQSTIRVLNSGEKNLNTLIGMEEGKKLWKMCLLLSLIFIACETLLLRFMK